MTEPSPDRRDAKGYFWSGFMAGTANAFVLVIASCAFCCWR